MITLIPFDGDCFGTIFDGITPAFKQSHRSEPITGIKRGFDEITAADFATDTAAVPSDGPDELNLRPKISKPFTIFGDKIRFSQGAKNILTRHGSCLQQMGAVERDVTSRAGGVIIDRNDNTSGEDKTPEENRYQQRKASSSVQWKSVMVVIPPEPADAFGDDLFHRTQSPSYSERLPKTRLGWAMLILGIQCNNPPRDTVRRDT